ncbi:DUF6884 domain-containing protein [Asanoa siamensis]|uniref:Uncharacterized protein n=1 Tax=Asanoa siamensis TaxID=926357 RepID=A0ABQ4CMX7_9ACTN|nr:DUF6884 domain-containing protein [Asanoa siamensis]GIF72639.1 hypothetical protein Asi02nite_21570 [Asanoa siamensis]
MEPLREALDSAPTAGYAIDKVVPGVEVTFVRAGSPELPAVPRGPADLLLVTCVKEKRGVPAAARDLYVSALFKKERAYAERSGVPWFILSAEHGLVGPDEWLAPYERYLPDTPAGYRSAWGRWVAERLELLAGPLTGRVVEVHAGAAYVDAISGPLATKGAGLMLPLHGLTMGERLAWYDAAGAGAREPAESDLVIDRLRSRGAAVTPEEFLDRQGAGLRVTGLYCWWVDAPGALDLSRGLGFPIASGIIYAGTAGATRWPSGRRSTNTLWARIAGMHLGGNHEFSTLRRTLGAILAAAAGSDSIDEPALTSWMHDRLKVVTVPYADADTLGRLEETVLKDLDPPLNLKGMPATPVRAQLTRLRGRHRL